MAADKGRAAYSRQWFVKAAKDLRVAELVLSVEPPFVEHGLFHCQQAIEKAFKGFLVWHNRRFRRVHHLGELGNQCVEIDAELESMVNRAAAFTEYASAFRYPEEPRVPDLQEARNALVSAREVVEAVLRKLPENVQP